MLISLIGGSVFSSPKVLTGAGNNPFAVRSSPGRVSNDSNSASSSCNSSNSVQAATGVCLSSSTSHPFKESHDGADFNGPSSKPLLRPSLIGSGSSFASSGTLQNHSILKPATLGNPFSRAVELADEDSSTTTVQQPVSQRNLGTDTAESKPTLLIPSRLNSVSAVGSSPTAPAAASEGSDEGSEVSGISVVPDLAPSESVVPLAIPRPSLTSSSLFSTTVTSVTSVATTPTPATPTACANFVFGQKLHERVANPNHTSTGPTSNGAEPTTNLFTVIPKEKSESEAASTNGMAASKTLSDSARELEEARAAKRKYDEVTVVTGEEDEQNALQVYGKLFTFDKVQVGTWIERGRGTLRLNDKQLDNHALQSRLVMRTQGCLRVILNTKIWAEMTIDKTSSKSIRMTAVDGDQIRVFLLMASLKDTETLFNALEWRLATLRAHQSRAAATASSIPDVDSSAALPAVPHNEDSASSPKRRALPVESEELGDETKKKRSE
uniref:EOG090X078K n=1 Tax=Daphnia magna TaxID=35525 RepID=A0A4Y7MP29_9CRUS|nr:EOG090X078K [Daphnia magna]